MLTLEKYHDSVTEHCHNIYPTKRNLYQDFRLEETKMQLEGCANLFAF